MELKDFVKKVIIDLDQAVSEATAVTDRVIRFKGVKEKRTSLEFDVAVTASSSTSGGGSGGIRVWEIVEIKAGGSMEQQNSVVSRVRFGVDISERTKEEEEVSRAKMPPGQSRPRQNEAL